MGKKKAALRLDNHVCHVPICILSRSFYNLVKTALQLVLGVVNRGEFNYIHLL